MADINETALDAGEEVVKSAGELHGAVAQAAQAAADGGIDHEEVQGWLTTIIKAILAAFK